MIDRSLAVRPHLAALVLAAVAAGPLHAAPLLSAPHDLNGADPAAVRITGLKPGQEVELLTTRRANVSQGFAPPSQRAFTAQARFRADGRGSVDLGRTAPVSGDYAGVDKAGLFWAAKDARAPQDADPAAGRVRIEARVDGRVVASAEPLTAPDKSALVTETVADFPGAVFVHPPGAQKRPAIIVLGGSEGGSMTAKGFAPRFAAEGYAVLGLPYYDPGWNPADRLPGLPRAFMDIPVDRLAKVREWLAARPDVDADRIGIWGASKGAEFALIAATRYPWIKAVAAVVPTDVVWEGWGRPGPAAASFAFDGQGLPFQRYQGMEAEIAKAAKGQPMSLRPVHDAGRKAHPEDLAAARIPVERYKGALVLVGGGDDQVWPSGEMAQIVAATRRKAGLPTVLVVEPHAGHGLGGPGYEPAGPMTALGGDAESNARARRLGWKATLETFDRALRPPRPAPRPAVIATNR